MNSLRVRVVSEVGGLSVLHVFLLPTPFPVAPLLVPLAAFLLSPMFFQPSDHTVDTEDGGQRWEFGVLARKALPRSLPCAMSLLRGGVSSPNSCKPNNRECGGRLHRSCNTMQ